MKLITLILMIASVATAQVYNSKQTIYVSGTPATIVNKSGATVVVVQEFISGSPTSATVVINGCTVGNTCTSLDTQTFGGTSYALRTLNTSTSYDHYNITPTWSGGTNVAATVEVFIPVPKATATINATDITSGTLATDRLAFTLPLSVANGGTGTATPNLVAGTNVTVSGTWPNQTVAASTTKIASGTIALGTSAIAPGAYTLVTATATGTLTTDVITAGFNGDPTGVTGYIPSTNGMLTIIAYPTVNTVNFKVCNNTSASITPGAITLNWRVAR